MHYSLFAQFPVIVRLLNIIPAKTMREVMRDAQAALHVPPVLPVTIANGVIREEPVVFAQRLKRRARNQTNHHTKKLHSVELLPRRAHAAPALHVPPVTVGNMGDR